ncbi:A24 family peptidase [Psychromonas sp. SP041]|uniref:prepilin peptidase n=1 Tax=Psychromonas sp. SP041 TaxID=1365007 RepID=UPI0010C7BAA4|nr:A24 family peptidase [Psychromonas sp. SP041]
MHQIIFNLYQINPFFISYLAILVGVCVGSYINVVCYRTPIKLKSELINSSFEVLEYFNIKINKHKELSSETNQISDKRSYCPRCNKPIPFYLNIPVLSWLFLKGKSACCHQKISVRYILVEIIFAAVYGLMFTYFDFGNAALLSIVFTFLFVISSVDLKIEIIPDPLVYFLIWSGLIYHAAFDSADMLATLLSIVLCYFIISALNVIFRPLGKGDAIGMGDAKLFCASAAWLGLFGLAWTFVFSPFVFFCFCMLQKRRRMAFGPSISYIFMSLMIIKFGLGIEINENLLDLAY